MEPTKNYQAVVFRKPFLTPVTNSKMNKCFDVSETSEATHTAGSFKCSKLGTTFAADLQKRTFQD